MDIVVFVHRVCYGDIYAQNPSVFAYLRLVMKITAASTILIYTVYSMMQCDVVFILQCDVCNILYI